MPQFEPLLPSEDRIKILKESASLIEDAVYQKELTEEELSLRREQLADNCIRLNQFEDDLKVVKDDFARRMSPLKISNKTILQEVKTKQATCAGVLYHLANHISGMMETYEETGILIATRRLRPDERQGNIFTMSKAN